MTVKVYGAYREIRSSAESSMERNRQLEDNIRSIQDLKASLASTSAPRTTTDPVSKLTTASISKANELLELLEYVRASGKKMEKM